MNDEKAWPQDAPDWLGWAVFLGPLSVYFAVGALIPSVWERVDVSFVADQSPTMALIVAITRLVITAAVIIWALRWIVKVFPVSVTPISIVVGLLGAAIWIGLCRANLESRLMMAIGLSPDLLGGRTAINPWELFPSSAERWAFLVARFSLLVIAVPIAEELFLRGFLIRFLEHDDWESLPLDQIGMRGLIVPTIYGILSHPSEWIAAAVWFSLITLLMVRTRRFWDCVVAHAVTNAVLGAYIVWAQDWRLW